MKLKQYDLERVLRCVCAEFNVAPAVLKGRSRTQKVYEARAAFVHLAGKITRRNKSDLGRFLERDHGAISHAEGRARDWLDTDPAYAERLAATEQAIGKAPDADVPVIIPHGSMAEAAQWLNEARKPRVEIQDDLEAMRAEAEAVRAAELERLADWFDHFMKGEG